MSHASITRREWIARLVGLMAFAPGLPIAKPPAGKAMTVAVLSSGTDRNRPIFAAFRKRLRELGYEDGTSVHLTFYVASARQTVTALAQAVVRDNPAVVVADGYTAARAIASLTRRIPIVAVTGNPVGRGLAESLARPGGNVTGVSSISEELDFKVLEIIREILPSAHRIAIAATSVTDYRLLEQRAAAAGFAIRVLPIHSLADAERELAPDALRDVDGVILPSNAFLASISAALTRLIDVAHKPAIYGDRDFVPLGGLAFYGISIEDAFHRAAELVDRVLNGANPAETPFEQPSRVELVINLRTARALQLSIPQSLLLRADEVIQ